jgi:hypothetical protein
MRSTLKDINKSQNNDSKHCTMSHVAQSLSNTRPGTHKRPHPGDSSSSESEGQDFNEFSMWLSHRRDKTISDPLEYWRNAGIVLFPRLQRIAKDVFAVQATGAGVEREFSISGRIITKHRNHLSPRTIRDLMQYKRWIARHERVVQSGTTQDRPTEIDSAGINAKHHHHTEYEKDLSR